MKPNRKVLVTGFGAFGGVRSNPTQRVVDHLNAQPPTDIDVTAVTMPVSWQEMPGLLQRHLALENWDSVLLLGVAASRSCWSVETTAFNRTANVPDASGQLPTSIHLLPGAPECLHSTWEASKVFKSIEEVNLPVQISADAGTYLCNAALYLSLHELGTAGTPVGFLHVPPDCDTMAASTMNGASNGFAFSNHLDAVRAVLLALVS